MSTTTAPATPGTQEQFFGHPRGLATLFFTEMWERFSYYGMRALLILFMVEAIREGGLGLSEQKAAAIYGLYTAGVYLLALPGGWVADRILGQRQAVFTGGVIIALGHFSMAVPTVPTFYLGLILIVLGTGLLKPNVSAIVGELYPEGGARRDAGFSIFYMGINVGALVGPLVCSFLGEKINWHLGFSAAGIGMVLGLIQYRRGEKYFGDAGHLKEQEVARRTAGIRALMLGIGAAIGIALVFAFLQNSGIVHMSVEAFARAAGVIIVSLAILFFGSVLISGGLDSVEKKRVVVIFILFLAAALFWSGFEQAGSSMNLFAKNLTNRMIFGWEAPAGWLQSVNPLFIIVLAPVFGWLWVALGSREPSMPIKFALGLFLLAVGFLVIAWGATYTGGGNKVAPTWLIVTYFLHTTGELCLSPVGLSSVTKLAPKRLVGQMMGTWFMGAALGNLIAGLLAGKFEQLPLPELFGQVAMITAGGGLLLLVFSRPIRRLTGGIH